MRLTNLELSAIQNQMDKSLHDAGKSQVFLFGSRINDNLKGGDIDLLIVIENANAFERVRLDDYKILAALKSDPHIGEQKIDLKIITPLQFGDPFVASIMKSAIPIWPRASGSLGT